MGLHSFLKNKQMKWTKIYIANKIPNKIANKILLQWHQILSFKTWMIILVLVVGALLNFLSLEVIAPVIPSRKCSILRLDAWSNLLMSWRISANQWSKFLNPIWQAFCTNYSPDDSAVENIAIAIHDLVIKWQNIYKP